MAKIIVKCPQFFEGIWCTFPLFYLVQHGPPWPGPAQVRQSTTNPGPSWPDASRPDPITSPGLVETWPDPGLAWPRLGMSWGEGGGAQGIPTLGSSRLQIIPESGINRGPACRGLSWLIMTQGRARAGPGNLGRRREKVGPGGPGKVGQACSGQESRSRARQAGYRIVRWQPQKASIVTKKSFLEVRDYLIIWSFNACNCFFKIIENDV